MSRGNALAWLFGGALVILVGACGGNVVRTPGSGGAGGTAADGGASAAGGAAAGGAAASGGAGGAATTCSDVMDCCQKYCRVRLDQVQCPTKLATCTCQFDGLPSACQTSLGDLFRCLLQAGAGAFECNNLGQFAPRCGVCDSQQQAMEQACGADPGSCAP